MPVVVGASAVILILVILWDAFETIVLPRRVRRKVRVTSVFFRVTRTPWVALARRMRRGTQREAFLSYYGPLALLFLLVVWAGTLVVSFAMLQWACGSALVAAQGPTTFGTDLYMSGTTFFTLGLGDVVPRAGLARALTVIEAGMGFGFLALVIGYLPVLYQAFSRREVRVSLLDARAGSPPTALELLRRQTHGGCRPDEMVALLREWEQWSAELLETHLSYPTLAYFRSQHEHQSWLAALTVILDVCALVLVEMDSVPERQVRLTFAMARHAAVDLSQVFTATPRPLKTDRLPPSDLATLREALAGVGLELRAGEAADEKLIRLRALYEPYVNSLAYRLLMPLPAWLPAQQAQDDWQASPWE